MARVVRALPLSARLPRYSATTRRFVDAKARKNSAARPRSPGYGTRRVVPARYASNRRLGDAVHRCAFRAL
jgi:hypothetical protein